MSEKTCRFCVWLLLIARNHTLKGQPQCGYCKRKDERVEADNEGCESFSEVNECIMRARMRRRL